MFYRKTKPVEPQPFSRIFASKWLAEYSGILPHSRRQGTTIEHSLFCTQFNPKRRDVFLAEGVEILEEKPPTHVLWCLCKLSKDRGDTRLLFRRNLYLPAALRPEWKDWVSYKLTQGIHCQLLALNDFYFLIPCKSKKEYYWCAQASALSLYWEMEISSRLKSLIAIAQK